MYCCQQILLHLDKETKAILEYICSESNKLYNCGLYYARQIYFKTGKIIGKFDLDKKIKSNIHFKAMRSCAAQQTLRNVYEGMRSYYSLRQKWLDGELQNQPRLPNYRKKGLYQVTYPKTYTKLIGQEIVLSLGKQVKAWFALDSFSIHKPSNLDYELIKEVRIIPRNRCFYAEFVYEKAIPEIKVLKPENVLGIDHGIDNWLTCVSNVNTSLIIDGRHLKSMNCWYNQKISTIKDKKPQGFWSKRLALITEKRNRQMRDAINKAARTLINHCLDNQIGTVVWGWNQGQKNGSHIGRKNNQKFVQIPTARLKERLSQLCQEYGINMIEIEESYTSKASAIDDDFIPTYGEKPDDWKPSGKRIARGLYRTKSGLTINADANGSLNIIRKYQQVSATLIDISRVSMGVLTRPQRLRLWSAKKTLRDADLSHRVASA